MSGLVARDVETLARSVCDADDTWTHSDLTDDHPCSRCSATAQALIDSGAVTPLADAVEALAEDEDLIERISAPKYPMVNDPWMKGRVRDGWRYDIRALARGMR